MDSYQDSYKCLLISGKDLWQMRGGYRQHLFNLKSRLWGTFFPFQPFKKGLMTVQICMVKENKAASGEILISHKETYFIS